MNAQQILAKLKQYPLAVGCVVVIIVMMGLSFMRGDRIVGLQNEAEQLQKQFDTILANAKDANELPENLDQIQALAEAIDSRVIDPDAKTDNYRYFLGMAEQANVNLVDPPTGQVSKPAEMKVYPLVSFPLQVSGEFKDVLNFVYLLRTGKHIMRIDSLTLSPRDSSGKYVVSMSLNTAGIGKPPENKK